LNGIDGLIEEEYSALQNHDRNAFYLAHFIYDKGEIDMHEHAYIWFNGQFQAWDNCNIHIMSHGLHYGFGVFEGIRAYKTHDGRSAIFRLDDHIRRLFDSAKIVGIEIPYTYDQIIQASLNTVAMNQLEEAYLRPIVFLGTGSFGINPIKNVTHTAIAVWKWGAYLGKEALEKGIKTKISSYTRFHPNSAMMSAKTTGNYALSVMAKVEAARHGCEEAILLDSDGYVAEGSGENIFIIRNNEIITPPCMSILSGITRDSVITLAKEHGYTITEQRFARDMLYSADEAFFTGTAAELTPIYSVDDRVIGAGKPGPITSTLQQQYFDVIRGKNSKHDAWLNYYTLSDPKIIAHQQKMKSLTD
jgi:branched-chain amino acid aminotransferase